MKSIIGLVIVGIVVIFGSRLVERPGAVSDFFKRFFAGGLAYLLLGVLLGPSGFSVFDENILTKFSPVTTIALYWIGFLFGINLRWMDLKKAQPSIYVLMLGQSLFTFFVVALAFRYIFSYSHLPMLGAQALVPALITLAACASGTSQSTIFRLINDKRFRGPVARVAAFTVSLDDMPAILICGLLTFFAQIPGEPSLDPLLRPPAAIFLGVGGGVILRSMLNSVAGGQTRLLIVLGGMAFGGGLAAYFHISPIFIGAIAGAAFANIGSHDEKVFTIVHQTESTMYVLFLLLVGGMFRIDNYMLPILGLAYFLIRAAGKVIGNYIFLAPARRYINSPMPLFGLAMLSQGGMALAIAVHYRGLFPSPLSDAVFAVIIIGVFISELVAYPLALRVAAKEF